MFCTKTLVEWWGAPRLGPSDDQVNEVGYCGVCGANDNLGVIPITIYLGVFYTTNGEKSPYEVLNLPKPCGTPTYPSVKVSLPRDLLESLRLTKEKTGQKKQFPRDPQATAQANTS
ncbi:hypothetical protein BHM03_00048068 [Ensete ventricosum]|nr:hypothetical protein BHM03_00048068 [Ensete ventricosum]